MVNCSVCCSRRPGHLRLHRVKPVTLEAYRKSLAKFVTWLDEVVKVPQGADEWDDAALEFSAAAGVSAGQMGTLVAALELFFPRFKKRIVLIRAESEGLQSTVPISHKTPLCRGPACLFAAQGASEGRARAGVALVIQQDARLRPAELLWLFPGAQIRSDLDAGPAAVLKRGTVGGTKARSEQVALIFTMLYCPSFSVFTYNCFKQFIADVCNHFELDVEFSGHSARAHFACEQGARNEAEIDVQHRGRGSAPSSSAVFVVIALSFSSRRSCSLTGSLTLLVYCRIYLLEFCQLAALACLVVSKDIHGCFREIGSPHRRLRRLEGRRVARSVAEASDARGAGAGC